MMVKTIMFKFNIGNVPMHDIKSNNVEMFVEYVKTTYDSIMSMYVG